ncbi:unnamed protein product [Acanthoscelides obtectus]|uniref:Uncharacterized protein n=1 Tax=Acanthoscelides obtectus TaxID=200917 RepID=A0A9P0KTX5_ACAOB|nr:unnamed protein product [Acanthoscelides obtectus]CAK1654837.1 hypothetical protein AOBTE_LOCUS18885 [Acanthoscelides obtectus]
MPVAKDLLTSFCAK